jgi:glyoxylase-like metal-dependent hydrolase (beta-lactamase superfamily II)
LLAADGGLLTGDTVLGRGTTVIAEDGSLGDYLRTLDELRTLADNAGLRVLLPGHGPLLADPAGVLDYYIAHRRERLDQVRMAVTAGARTPAEIVATVYADVDRAVWPAAELSVRAQLDYLNGI